VTDLTTLAAVKLYSGITTTADDALLSSLITAYSQWVRSYQPRLHARQLRDLARRPGQPRSCCCRNIRCCVTLLEVDGKAIAAQRLRQPGYRFTDTSSCSTATVHWGQQNVHVQIFTAGYATSRPISRRRSTSWSACATRSATSRAGPPRRSPARRSRSAPRTCRPRSRRSSTSTCPQGADVISST
jgi:hypothetical protein